MSRHLKYGLLILFLIGMEARSQNIFILEKATGGRIRWYHTGDFIDLGTAKGERIEGRINFITDSSLIVGYSNEIMISDIEMIYRKRHMLRLLQNLSLIGGMLYISISALNGVINNDAPIVPGETLKISGGMVAAAVLLTPLVTRRHKIMRDKWKVKILDFTD